MTARMLILGFILILFCLFSACETTTESISSESADILVEQVESSNAQAKVDICHATSSETNPWVLISISEKAIDKHLSNHGDLYPGDQIDDDTMLSDECLVEENDGVDTCPLGACDEQCEDVDCDTTGDPGDILN